MKLLWFVFTAAAAISGDLSQMKAVYILPMAGGLDQHVADRLTQSRVLLVVTDPNRADVVLTDRLGPGFEQKMTELYPPPPPPAKPVETKAEPKEQPPAAASAMLGDTVNKVSKPMSSFGGGKGTIFLVHVKSREVLWSTYERPKDARAAQMEKTATRICDDLKKSISRK